MSFGVPGGSFNTTYFVLCGGGLTAALVYVSIDVYINKCAGFFVYPVVCEGGVPQVPDAPTEEVCFPWMWFFKPAVLWGN